MGIVKDYLDPNAAAYTDDEIVGKVNTATANITRAGSIEGTAASALDSDNISEGTSNKYDTGVPPTATETTVLRTYYRIVGAAAYILQDSVTYAGVLDPDLINIDLEPNRYGIQVTIEKTAGTNRAYPWEVFYEVH